HGAADQDQVALDVDPDDLKVLHGTAHVTHVTGHALALEHPPRRLALTDGTRHAVRNRVTVGSVLRAELVPLDGAGKALALGRACDVHLVTRLEHVDLDFATDPQVLDIHFLEYEHPETKTGVH